jgi:hypothetical protein
MHKVLARFPIELESPAAVAAKGQRSRVITMGAVAAVCLALAAAGALVPQVGVPAPVAAVLVVTALVLVGSSLRQRRVRGRAAAVLEVDTMELRRVDPAGRAPPRTLMRWDEATGITVLSNCVRSRALLAFTSRQESRYVPVRMSGASDRAISWLGTRAVSVADADLSADTGDAQLSAADAVSLLELCEARSPGILGRVYLTSAHGDPVDLEPGTLRVGRHVFDLAAPLEWRATTFHESLGPLTTVYQATEVSQGAARVVLVAQMPAELSMGGDLAEAARRDPALREAVMADLRLIQASPDQPPPVEQRIAIDRLFVVPLRRALDLAPKVRKVAAGKKGKPAVSPLG